MPLLDDLGLAPRSLSPRDQMEEQRTTQSSLAGGTSTTSEDLKDLLRRKTEQKQNAPHFRAMLDSVLKDTSTPSSTPQGAALISAGRSAGAAAAALAGGGATSLGGSTPRSEIIGTRNYQIGRGDPAVRQQAQYIARMMGWDQGQFDAWDALINAESGWRPTAQNPTSTAYGLGQFLDSTWKSYGAKTSDPALQLYYMAQYIRNRYQTPLRALQEHRRKNWY